MPANLENSAVTTGLAKVSFQSNAKECTNWHVIMLISHASKVMFKILQVRLQEYINQELPDVQTGFQRGRGSRDQMANICWIMQKAREFQKKKSTSASLHTLKCMDHSKLWNIFKGMEYQIVLPVS